MNPSPRVNWIDHAGVNVLTVDLRSATREEQLVALEAYAVALGQSRDAEVNVLAAGDAALDFFPDVSTRAKAMMTGQESKVRRSALVGFSGITLVAFDGFFSAARLLGKDLRGRGRHFETEERAAALDWLVAQ